MTAAVVFARAPFATGLFAATLLTLPAAAGDVDLGPFPLRYWDAMGEGYQVTVGDFTGDNRVDVVAVVVVNNNSFPVLIRQIGQGRFEPPIALPYPIANAYSVASADLNGDGKLDVVVGGANDIVALLGDGTGGFGTPITIPSASAVVTSIALGDLDLDGKLDLVAAGQTLQSFKGDGFGGFALQSTLAVGFTFTVRLARLDGDGLLDLAASSYGSNSFERALGTGACTFGPVVTVPSLTTGSLLAEDLDGDGATDVLVSGGTNVVVHKGDGLGGFAAPVSYSLGAAGSGGAGSDPEAADLDGDGRKDVVVLGGLQPSTVAVFRNLGATLDTVQLFDCGGGAFDSTIADVDGDGRLDVVAVLNSAEAMVWMRGNGDGTLNGSAQLQTANSVAVPGDFNGDGMQDVAITIRDTNRIEVRLGDGLAGFTLGSSVPIGHSPNRLAVGFLDAGNTLDVVSINWDSTVTVLRGNGNGTFQSPQSAKAVQASAVAIGDLTGDGVADVVLTEASSNRIAILPGNGAGGLSAPVFKMVGVFPVDLLLNDLDADGDLDVLTANLSSDDVTVLTNNGAGSFTSATFPIATHNPLSLALGELTGDALPDLLVSTQADSTEILPRTGASTFGTAFELPFGAAGSYDTAIADFSGDGLNDVVQTGVNVVFFLGQPGGHFGPPRNYFDGTGVPQWIESIDANSDARADILVSGYGTAIQLSVGMAIEPTIYCTAKLNSLGCPPAIGSSGLPSASSSSGFTVRAGRVRNRTNGLILYSAAGRIALPFAGGLQCVPGSPARGKGLFSNGNASGHDCSGVYQIDMNAFAAGALGGHPLPELSIVGTVITCQFWGRDPGFIAPNNVSLSDALEYTVQP